MAEEMRQVQLGDTGEIELPKVDVEEYIGKKAKIAEVKEKEGQYGSVIVIYTEDIGTLKNEKGDIIEKDNAPVMARASRLFGLKEDVEGRIGWTKESPLGCFLEKMKVDHYRALKGKEVTIQGQESNGRTFLTFI